MALSPTWNAVRQFLRIHLRTRNNPPGPPELTFSLVRL